ncbi:MAG: hypothetical protein KGJ06_01430, partial [Pseudomonadota bacterium]|nr:hypothetical protein [Pseudomonadota bacterium]
GARGPARIVALNVLVFQAILVATGILAVTLVSHWSYPIPLYYELLYIPLYALFAAYAGEQLLNRWRPRRPALALLLPALLLTPAAFFLVNRDAPERQFPIPSAGSPLTDRLERDIGIAPGRAFAGRVVSMIAGKTFDEQEQYFYAVDHATGNDHFHTGLWLHDIPTLTEYNQLLTPAFFWFTEQFLQEKPGEQRRNWINFSRLNLPALRLLGVRYILTPDTAIPEAALRETLPVKGKPNLNLFELDKVNTNGVFVTQAISVHGLAEAKDAIAASFAAPAAVLLGEEKLPPLIAGRDSHIEIERGGWHITARSDGASLLIVPFEYSRCLDLTVHNGPPPQAIRADAVLTGLLFDRTLDVTMAARVGEFHRPDCRWQDYKEFRRLMQQP